MSEDLSKYGNGYIALIHILRHPQWFKGSVLSITRFLKSKSSAEKHDMAVAMVTGRLVMDGERASDIPQKIGQFSQPISTMSDQDLAQYILKLGYNNLQMLLRSYARYKVLSTKMKRAS